MIELDYAYDPHVTELQAGFVISDGRGRTIGLRNWTELSAMSTALMDAVDGIRLREYEEDRKADQEWKDNNR